MEPTEKTEVIDRIEKNIALNAPKSRVWRAISNAQEFGEWFGLKINGTFSEGVTVIGQITYPGYEHMTLEMVIDRIEPENLFSYKWHPYAIQPEVDYSAEPMTLVEFRLEEVNSGTLLTIVESGFDKIPAERRAEAYKMDSHGWEAQIENIQNHVTKS